jgi:hypothetical protein
MMLTAAFALSLIVNVSVPANVPELVVTNALIEAAEIWRPAAVSFVWRRNESMPARLRVIIGPDLAPAHAKENALPIGWVHFDDGQTPAPDIYLSYENAERLFETSRGTRDVTRFEHHTLIGRALGRALAHELGHVLLASKNHTPRGLMQATRTANEFFAPQAMHFEITPAQRAEVAAHLRTEALVASS